MGLTALRKKAPEIAAAPKPAVQQRSASRRLSTVPVSPSSSDYDPPPIRLSRSEPALECSVEIAQPLNLSSLAVSSPHDASEKEATAIAGKIVRMGTRGDSVSYVNKGTGGVYRLLKSPVLRQSLEIKQRADTATRSALTVPLIEREPIQAVIHRKADSPAAMTSSSVNASIKKSLAGGEPLPIGVRQFMEPRFGADFSNVRIHKTGSAASLNKQLNARAFTTSNHIFFGENRYKPETAQGKELIAHELTHTIQQGGAVQRSPRAAAVQREADAAVVQRSDEPQVGVRQESKIQRGILDFEIPNPLDWLAGKANNIPGFRILTIILGVNPINMSSVDRSAANILRALIELMPGGGLVTEALDNHGVFDKAGAFVEQQVDALGMTGSAIKNAVDEFISSLDLPGDLLSPGATWARAERIFTEPIEQLKNFAVGLVTGIVALVKEAILKPIAALAEGTEGYALLKAVMGKDPITGEAYPQTAENIIGPFLKLIGQDEIWANMQKSGAIPRAFAWFKGALGELMGFVNEIPGLFVKAFTELELEDIILLPRAFAKLAGVFGDFLGRFTSWVGDKIWTLLEIIFDVVSPGAFAYVKKTGAALKSILQNPLPFVGNLVKAAKLGFQNFAGNFLTHLKRGLIDWLVGALPGVYIPKALSLPEVGKFALSVLGITWAQIRGKIVKALGPNGETIMRGLETAFDIVVALVKGGPAAAWEVIKDKLTGLKDQVISGITSLIVEIVVTKAVPKLIAMFIPGAGFISAIISIYDTIMVFVNKIKKIIQVVTAFIDSIVSIANGAIGAAVSRVESVLGGLLSLAISFLAGFAGLGKIADKVMGVIGKVRATVDKAIDTAINFIVSKAKTLFAKLFSKKDKDGKPAEFKEGTPEYRAALDAGLKALAAETKRSAKKDRIEKKTAVSVASQIVRTHRVFKAINVIDAGKNWDFEYSASGPTKFPGAHKGNGQLRIVSVKVKDPNTKGLLARAKAAVMRRGAAWAAAAKKFVDSIMLGKIERRVGSPIEPRDQFSKMPSAQYLARLNYEKTLAGEEPFKNIPDALAEIMTPPGSKKEVAQVIAFEFTVVEDFYKTDAEGKPDKFAFHKMDQYFKTVQNLISKYGKDVPIVYYFIAPREPTDDTKDYLAGVLTHLGATNIRVVWVAVS